MRYALLFMGWALVHLSAHPANAADIEAGAAIAAEHCSECHDIGPGGAFKEYPPTFAAIAVFRTREQIYLRIAAPAAHSGMPDVAFYKFDRKDMDDLLAYITSLEE